MAPDQSGYERIGEILECDDLKLLERSIWDAAAPETQRCAALDRYVELKEPVDETLLRHLALDTELPEELRAIALQWAMNKKVSFERLRGYAAAQSFAADPSPRMRWLAGLGD